MEIFLLCYVVEELDAVVTVHISQHYLLEPGRDLTLTYLHPAQFTAKAARGRHIAFEALQTNAGSCLDLEIGLRQFARCPAWKNGRSFGGAPAKHRLAWEDRKKASSSALYRPIGCSFLTRPLILLL